MSSSLIGQRSFPKITEQGMEDLQRRIGVKIGATAEPWCYEATRDNIRHYAHGIGDDNPLWCDPEYAAYMRCGQVQIGNGINTQSATTLSALKLI